MYVCVYVCVGVLHSCKLLQEEWKTLDASVLEATEALGEKREKAMKAQEEKDEEKLHRENVRMFALFSSPCVTICQNSRCLVVSFPSVKKSLCTEKAALDQSGLRSSRGWRKLWMTRKPNAMKLKKP